MTSHFTIAIAAAAAMLAANAAQQARAESADSYTVTIRTADLDLASRAGQATLNGRIGRAAERACGEAPVAPISQVFAAARCRAALSRSALAQLALVRRPDVTRLAGTR